MAFRDRLRLGTPQSDYSIVVHTPKTQSRALIYDPEAIARVISFAKGPKQRYSKKQLDLNDSEVHSRSYSHLASIKESLGRTGSQGTLLVKSNYSLIAEYNRILSKKTETAEETEEDIKPRKPHDSKTHSSLPTPKPSAFTHITSLSFMQFPLNDAPKAKPRTRSRAWSSDFDSRLHYYHRAHRNSVTSLLASDAVLLSASADYTIALWNRKQDGEKETCQLRERVKGHKKAVSTLAWVEIGEKFLSGGSDLVPKLWSIEDDRISLVFRLPQHTSPITRLLCPFPTLAISGNSSGQIQTYDLATGKLVSAMEQEHSRAITGLVQQACRTVLSSARDGCIKLWDLRNKRSIAAFEGHLGEVHSISLWDEYSFFSSGADCTLRKWDFRTTSTLQSSECASELRLVHRLTPHLLVANPSLYLWNLNSELKAHSGAIRSLESHGDTLFAGGTDGCISVWKL